MVLQTANSSYLCNYNFTDLMGTLKNHDSLDANDRCLHIRKAFPPRLGVEFYVMADWPCFQSQPVLGGQCDKSHSSNVRVTITKNFKSPAKNEQYVTFKLISKRRDYLEFQDGIIGNSHQSILSYVNPPLLLVNTFWKTKQPAFDTKSFLVIKRPQVETIYVPLIVSVNLWDGAPKKSKPYSLEAYMSLAISPNISGKNKVRQKKQRGKKLKREEKKMDPELLDLIAKWLLPFAVKGTLELSKSVGKGLGESFINLFEDLVKDATSSGPRDSERLTQEAKSEFISPSREMIIVAISKNPGKAQQFDRELRTALKKLLRNNLFFTKSDIQDKLMSNMGYSDGDFDTSTQDRLANNFVDKIFADQRVEGLIKEIQEMKPNLFEKEN